MATLEFEITVGKKTGSQLIYTHDRHLFKLKSKDTSSRALHVCHIKGCPAKIKIENGNCTYMTPSHIHGTQEAAYEEYRLNNRIKERCVKEKKRPREIFNEECSESSLPMQYAKRQRTYQLHQRKGIPRNPKTVDEVRKYFEQEDIQEKFGKTINKDQPLPFYKETVITALFSYVIFCSEYILQNLPPIRRLFIDRTFKVVPAGPFKQLLIIGIELDGHMFPCFFVLMTKKSQAAYTHLLQQIEKTFSLQSIFISTDYEKGLRNALRNQYPAAELVGCWFHYSQAILRKAKKIKGFLLFLKSNECAKTLFRKFKNLPLIREDKIIIAFTMLKTEAERFGSRFSYFINYFEEEWIKRVGANLICVFLKAHRTNNLVESYNSDLKSKIPPSGCFFGFVEFLQKEELIKSKDYKLSKNGGTQVYAHQRNKYKERDEFISRIQKKFESDQRFSVSDFFDAMDKLNESDDNTESENSLSSDDDNDDDTTFCVVCKLNSRTTLLEPCNELKFCQICVNNLMIPRHSKGRIVKPTCPTCGTVVTGSKNVFFFKKNLFRCI